MSAFAAILLSRLCYIVALSRACEILVFWDGFASYRLGGSRGPTQLYYTCDMK